MELKSTIAAGVLLSGLAAGITMAQNRLDLRGSVVPSEIAPGQVNGIPSPNLPVAQAGFADAGQLSLDRLADGAYASSVRLYNPLCTPKTVELTAYLLGRNGEPFDVTLSSSNASIPAGQSITVDFSLKPKQEPAETASEFGVLGTVWAALRSSSMSDEAWRDHLPAQGKLVARQSKDVREEATVTGCTASGVPSSARRDLILKQPLPSPVDTGVLLASLFLAGAATLLSALIILGSKDVYLRARMGNVTFDFNKSWGTNVAIGAGVLSVLISQTQNASDSKSYLILSGLFLAFVPLGAALYNLIRPPGTGTQPQGYVGMYLLSSGVVLWGAFGQLLLLGLILKELDLARVMSSEPASTLIFMTKGLILFLVVYAVRTALAAVKESSWKASEAKSASTPRPSPALI